MSDKGLTGKETWKDSSSSRRLRLEGQEVCVTFLSKEGRRTEQRKGYSNGPQGHAFVHLFKQPIPSTHRWSHINRHCALLMRKVVWL